MTPVTTPKAETMTNKMSKSELNAALKNAPVASRKFRIGQRVRFSDAAHAAGLVRMSGRLPHWGTVVGFSRRETMVRIKRDGAATYEVYHPAFWIACRSRVEEPSDV